MGAVLYLENRYSFLLAFSMILTIHLPTNLE